MTITRKTRHIGLDGRRAFTVGRLWLALPLALLLAGCNDLFVPDFNNPGVQDLEGNPTRAQIASGVAGVIISSRLDYDDYLEDVAVIGREALELDAADPGFITELLISLEPGSRAFGADHWLDQYMSIRGANILLSGLERSPLDETEREAVRGFVQTLQALNFLIIINTRDTNGAAVDVGRPVGELAPLVSKEQVFEHIAQLLDGAQTHLQAGGGVFPFRVPPGFTGFDTPATFILFNRALKARLEVYRGDFAAALVALNESFFVDCADFDRGVYFDYSTGAGEKTNDVFENPANPNLRAHPSVEANVERQPGGALDQRFLDKVVETDPKTLQDYTSDLAFTVYDGPADPIPIIRNEELILLRAEANIGLGNVGAAATDLNCIRTQVGKLAARTDLTAANALDELLKQKFYSLLLEGGHHWIDMRRYGRIPPAGSSGGNGIDQLPVLFPAKGEVVHPRYPIPRNECLAREGSTDPCPS